MLESLGGLITSSALLYMMAGTLLGLIFGAIPGLTATLAVVILIPLTYSLGHRFRCGDADRCLYGRYIWRVCGAIMLNMRGPRLPLPRHLTDSLLPSKEKREKRLEWGIPLT